MIWLPTHGAIPSLCFKIIRPHTTHLEAEFNSIKFEDFTSVDAYCTHLQSLADRLEDFDTPVTKRRLVLHLTGTLPVAYSGAVDYI